MKKLNWVIFGPLFVIIGASLWGTETYFRVILNTRFDAEVLVFYEHLFCIFFSLPFAFNQKLQISGISKRAWVYLFLSGTLGSAVGTTFFTMSLNSLNSSVANVLLNFQPLVSTLFAALLLGERLTRRFFLWGVVALSAGLVLASNGFKFENLTASIGLLYISIAALTWGFSTVAGRGAMLEIPLRLAVPIRFIIGAVTLFTSLLVKGKVNATTMNWMGLGEPLVVKNFVYLSLLAGVVPLFFYFKGLSKTPASVGGFCELSQTFSALLLTWGVMGQALTLTQSIAGLTLVGAVYMANLSYSK
jgi:drug/metabolite transporter (DMT)-like permease